MLLDCLQQSGGIAYEPVAGFISKALHQIIRIAGILQVITDAKTARDNFPKDIEACFLKGEFLNEGTITRETFAEVRAIVFWMNQRICNFIFLRNCEWYPGLADQYDFSAFDMKNP